MTKPETMTDAQAKMWDIEIQCPNCEQVGRFSGETGKLYPDEHGDIVCDVCNGTTATTFGALLDGDWAGSWPEIADICSSCGGDGCGKCLGGYVYLAPVPIEEIEMPPHDLAAYDIINMNECLEIMAGAAETVAKVAGDSEEKAVKCLEVLRTIEDGIGGEWWSGGELILAARICDALRDALGMKPWWDKGKVDDPIMHVEVAK